MTMLEVRRMRAGVTAACVLASLAAAGAAQADSIVYVDGQGHLAIADADGSGSHAVLSTTGWSYPSESDNGTVAALAPNGAIGLMSQYGAAINTVPTQSSVSGGWDATIFPRISPDGGKVAWTNLDPGADPASYWAPSSNTSLTTPNQTLGEQDTTSPSWIDSTHMMLTHFGVTVTPGDWQFALFNTTQGGDNSATQFGFDAGTPAAPTDTWSATGFGGAINRQQTVVALAMDDAADWSPSAVHNAAVDLLPVVNGTVDASHECRIMLQNANGAAATTASDAVNAGNMISPSFSPDGTEIAFATNSGVWEYTVPTNLGSIANGPVQACGGTARLVISGGSFPFWSPAALKSAPTSPTQTNPTNPTHPSNVISKVAVTQGHLAQIAKGVKLSLRCSRSCSGKVQISISAVTAKKLHLSKRAITFAAAHFSAVAGKTVIVTLKPAAGLARRLKKLHSLAVTVTARPSGAPVWIHQMTLHH